MTPFAAELTLPRDIPKDLSLAYACWSDRNGLADLSYFGENGKGKIIVTIHRAVLESSSPSPEDRSTIPLGDVIGVASSKVEEDGTRFYAIQFDKESLSYTIGARLGSGNTVSEGDLRVMALSIAEN